MPPKKVRVVHTKQVLQRLQTNEVTLCIWRTVYCPAVGKKLWAKPSAKGGHKFLESEIHKIEALPALSGTWRQHGIDWLSGQETERRRITTIGRLESVRSKRCDFLEGKIFRAQKVLMRSPGMGGCRSPWFYHPDDVARMGDGPRQSWTLTATEAIKECKRNGLKVAPVTMWKWLVKKCPFLDGEKLPSKPQTNRTVAKKRNGRLVDSRVETREILKRDIQRVIDKFLALKHKNGDGLTSDVEAKELFGFGQSTMSYWRTDGCRELDGAKLPSEDVETLLSNNEVRQIKKSPVAILQDIYRKRNGLPPDAEVPGRGMDGADTQANGASASRVTEEPKKIRAKTIGRGRSADTEELYKACYFAYINAAKVSVARQMVESQFGKRAPSQKTHLRLFAKRYAERHGLSLQRKSVQNLRENQGAQN